MCVCVCVLLLLNIINYIYIYKIWDNSLVHEVRGWQILAQQNSNAGLHWYSNSLERIRQAGA